MIQLMDGTRICGETSLEVVRYMRSLAFGCDGMSIMEYCGWALRNAVAWGSAPKTQRTLEGSDDDVADAFLDEIVNMGLAIRLM